MKRKDITHEPPTGGSHERYTPQYIEVRVYETKPVYSYPLPKPSRWAGLFHRLLRRPNPPMCTLLVLANIDDLTMHQGQDVKKEYDLHGPLSKLTVTGWTFEMKAHGTYEESP